MNPTKLNTHTLFDFSDIDECQDASVCGTALCQNNKGSYDCLCEDGYVYDNKSKSCVGESVQPFTIRETGAVLFDLAREQCCPQQAPDVAPL